MRGETPNVDRDELDILAHATVGAVVGSGWLMRLLFPRVWDLAWQCWSKARQARFQERRL
jgi:hypothetical protein